MGVYIDMEMPDNCDKCKIRYGMFCPVLNRFIDEGRRHNCPLAEIPEPHGRLIDADKLNYTMLYKENWMRGTGVEALAVWRKDIDTAPTIIPASEEGRVMTNAGKIRAMTDEELAELLVSTDGDFPPNCESVPVRKLEAYWLDWLKQEVE